jgi:DNA-binding SARP family transcriptional activator/Tfp pilus assembly protein PilF
MEFGLLGPLVARCGGVDVMVPKGKQRALLSVLLLNAGRVVPVSVLVEALWGPQPPPSAEASIWNHVKRLRQVLGEAGRERICTRPPGYLIRVADDELDVLRFEALLEASRAAARNGAWQDAAHQARAALALWRGEPLTDAESDALALREVPRLTELRMQAVETQLEADLHLSRHAEVIAELERLTAAHPLREHLYSLLMLALYRCGRQAEALASYQRAREVLVEEIGTEPGPELQELHQQILSADPELAVTGSARPAEAEPQPTTPRELPSALPGFIGRSAELRTLTGLLDRPGRHAPEAVVISAIGGTAGVGKTALAVQWAHTAADRFPDGQLYVNLRGYDPDQPMPATDALARFLRALGVPGQDIPLGEDERAARYRSVLAGKRVMVVLDNARSVQQVRPLLPGSATCAVVVTSRDALVGLVARDGAVRLELDLLPPAEAIGLLRELIGRRADDDPGAATTLAAQCCRLPLALRVAAELAASRPDVPLAELAGELADQQRRLDLLDAGGDSRTAVRAVFSWSHRHLDPAAARAFRLAGLHPGADFDPYAAAALTGTGLSQARTVLDALARAHLIQPARPGRYLMHDLLRAYARELADATDGEKEQDAALIRLFDHYLHTAVAAMDTLHPAERHRRPPIPPPDTPAPPVAEPTAARAWLDAELTTLVAVTVNAARHGRPSHATQLSKTLGRYLDNGGHYPEAITIHSHARAAAQRAGNPAAEATALNGLGAVDQRQGRYQQGADHLRQALALFRQAGDRTGQGNALNNLGIIHQYLGHYREAIGLYRQALAIFGETGDRVAEGNALNNLGETQERLGRCDLAARHHRQALAIAAEMGHRDLECSALVNLGTVGLRQHRYRQAVGYLDRALTLSRETGWRHAEADALARSGDLCLRQGRPEEAVRYLREALALSREIGNQSGEADALNSLGEVLLATGEPDHARDEHAAALRLAAQAGDRYQQARAHHGLGQACHAVRDAAQARRHEQQALALFTELGTPEADQVRAQLAAAQGGSHPEQEASR